MSSSTLQQNLTELGDLLMRVAEFLKVFAELGHETLADVPMSVHPPVPEEYVQSINQPINQPINQSAGPRRVRPINQPINQSTNQQIRRSPKSTSNQERKNVV